MSANSSIEWTDATWNPVTGCDHVSPGCDNCYAETIAKRFGRPFIGAVECHEDRLELPLRWRKPRRVFVNSVSDLFHPDVPDDFLISVWCVMEEAVHNGHTFQILTKRPQRMAKWINERLGGYAAKFDDCPTDAMKNSPAAKIARDRAANGVPGIWLGVSVENQRYADMRIPHLLATPAAVRFLSVEPMLGPVSLTAWLNGGFGTIGPDLHWVICGGESGHGARPMHPTWARDLRDECVAAGVPFFFKQWGAYKPVLEHLATTSDAPMRRTSKKEAGRELDGRTWDEYPA
jgi:protein gp37